jgi:DsbC/DsbD-like thiol-disulfide interchange protein
MKFIPLLLTLLCCKLTAFGAGFGAGFGLELPRLSVELISETSSIAPGKPFTVGVKMTHIEHGHSYWLNPGGPGKASKFIWTLPPGFAASEPLWPAPIVAESASFLSYLYEGEIMPLVTITPSASVKVGETVKLEILVDALVCIEDCLPQKVTAALTAAVGETGTPDPAKQAAFAKARAALPVAAQHWTFTADTQPETERGGESKAQARVFLQCHCS